jgi:hypothetical protein
MIPPRKVLNGEAFAKKLRQVNKSARKFSLRHRELDDRIFFERDPQIKKIAHFQYAKKHS